MTISGMIKLGAAQHQLLAEYPQLASEESLTKTISSEELRKHLARYRNTLHQKFVVFHIAETAMSIRSEMEANDALSEKMSSAREAYGEIYVKFAEKLGDAATHGAEGNYFSMLSQSVGAVIHFFKSDSRLRSELHRTLQVKLEASAVDQLQAFIDGDGAVDQYLNMLSASHFYFQSEIESLHRSGQIKQKDFQEAIRISSTWKEEVITGIINLRDYNFHQYASLSKQSAQARVLSHRRLALRLVSEFLICPQKTGKIDGLFELGHLKNKLLNARRDVHIAEAINGDVAIRMESVLQNREIVIDKNSLQLKAIVATLKREVVRDGESLFNEADESLLSVLSDRLSLLTKPDMTEDERLTLYSDYYFNQVDRESVIAPELEKQLIPKLGFSDVNEHKGKKHELFFQTLKYLSTDLLKAPETRSQPEVMHKKLLLMQEKIQTILSFCFNNFRNKLLHSCQLTQLDPRKASLFALQYINQLLKQTVASDFYDSYFAGLIKFKAVLPSPCQLMVMEDPINPGQVKVKFLGEVFGPLNQLIHAKQGWGKVRAALFIASPSHRTKKQGGGGEERLAQTV